MAKLRKEREVKIGRETGKTEPYVAARAFFKNLKRGGRQKFCDLPRDISELLQIKARGNSVQNLNETTVQKRQIVNRNLRNNYKRRNQKFLLGALIVFNGACILPISLLLCALRLAKGIKDIWFIALESLSQEICNLWSVLPSRHGLLLVPNWPSQKITPFMLKVLSNFITWQIWKLVLCQC